MRGHTLLELVTVLTLFGVTASAVAPTTRRMRDRAAVSAAREALVGLLAEARAHAMRAGGASVTISAGPWRAVAATPDTLLRAVELERDLQVAVDLGAGRTSAVLRYDGLGLGRVASQTIEFSRGDATAALVVSSFGRVRRR